MANPRENSSDNYTHINIVLDKSGSMASTLNDTIGGFNQFLNDQKEIDGRASITFVQFNGSYDVQKDMEPLEDIEDLTRSTYTPSGGTALLDAIGSTINRVESQIEEMEDAPDRVIFVIITDGEENSSREFSRENIFEMIQRKEDEDNWNFVFIGANQDAIQAGRGMGVRAGNALTYASSDIGTQAMYTSLSRGMTGYRSSAVVDASMDYFSAEDREAQEEINETPSSPLNQTRSRDINNLYRMDLDEEVEEVEED